MTPLEIGRDMKANIVGIAVVALVLSGCAAAPVTLPTTGVTTPSPTPTPVAVGLKAACEQAAAITADLSEVPDADQYASAAEAMYVLVESGDRDAKEVFTSVEAALRLLSTASPGAEYIKADQELLESLDAANERCLAVGSDVFN